MRGLYWHVHNAMLPAFTGKESLTKLIKHASVISRNLEFGKSLESKTRSSSSSTTHTSSASGTSVLSVNCEMDSSGKFLMKLIRPEKDYLSKNKGCFNCHKIKASHFVTDCSEDHSGSGVFIKGRFLKKELIKKESSVSALIVESESDSEYSCLKSILQLRLPLK
jgi:hypothetical protein